MIDPANITMRKHLFTIGTNVYYQQRIPEAEISVSVNKNTETDNITITITSVLGSQSVELSPDAAKKFADVLTP